MSIARFKRLIKKRWFRQRLIKLSFGWAVFILAASMLSAILFGGRAVAHDPEDTVYYKYYKNVRVECGDTLWKYAGEYKNPAGESRRDYIEEVKSINHIEGDSIKAGSSIVLPYYSAEYVCSLD